MTDITIKQLETDDELYCHYQGQTQRQPVHLCLNLEEHTLEAYYDSNIGGGQTMRAFHGRDIEWTIPPLRRSAFAELADDVKEFCETILKHSTVEWNGSNFVGHLDEEAEAAVYSVESAIADLSMHLDPNDVWEPWDAGIYLDPSSDEELGLTAESSDEDIERIAKELVDEAEVVLEQDDVERVLRHRVENLQDDDQYL